MNISLDYTSHYYPGRLIVLTNELFNKQKITQKENNILYWKTYTEKYFSHNCLYSIIMKTENQTWSFSMNI
jgi:hypothetical protein